MWCVELISPLRPSPKGGRQDVLGVLWPLNRKCTCVSDRVSGMTLRSFLLQKLCF